MPFDARAEARRPVACPVTVPIPARPLGPLALYRTARRNLLELVPAEAYEAPILSGGGRRGWHMVQDPDALEHILKRREDIYPRSDVTLRILRPNEGESIFTAYGPSWKRQHKAMVPVFNHRAILGVAPVMTAAAEAAAGRLASGPEVADVYGAMIDATCDVICDTALSGREQVDRPGLSRAVARYLGSVARISALDLLGAPGWIPRPGKLLDRTGHAMDRTMDRIIAERRARGPGAVPDVLDLMIAAEDPETGQRMSAVELRNNLMSFIVAGHETTALVLTWALYLLAFDAGVQAKARGIAQGVLGDRAATAEDVGALGYFRQILEEAMRLYPPAALMTRTARGEDEVLGRSVRPGMTMILPIYALHRHRALWEAPDAFDPERFAPEAVRARHRYAHLPFSAGPRICIGLSFAFMEMVILLATLAARFEFRLVPGAEPRPEMLLTLRPTGGVRLAVRRL